MPNPKLEYKISADITSFEKSNDKVIGLLKEQESAYKRSSLIVNELSKKYQEAEEGSSRLASKLLTAVRVINYGAEALQLLGVALTAIALPLFILRIGLAVFNLKGFADAGVKAKKEVDALTKALGVSAETLKAYQILLDKNGEESEKAAGAIASLRKSQIELQKAHQESIENAKALSKETDAVKASNVDLEKGLDALTKTTGKNKDAGKDLAQTLEKIGDASSNTDIATQELRKSFADLGISYDQVIAKSPNDLLLELAAGYTQLEDKTKANAALTRILGEEQARSFEKIAGSLTATKLEVQQLGETLNKDGRQALENYEKQLGELEKQFGKVFQPFRDILSGVKRDFGRLVQGIEVESAAILANTNEFLAAIFQSFSDNYEKQLDNILSNKSFSEKLNAIIKQALQNAKDAGAAVGGALESLTGAGQGGNIKAAQDAERRTREALTNATNEQRAAYEKLLAVYKEVNKGTANAKLALDQELNGNLQIIPIRLKQVEAQKAGIAQTREETEARKQLTQQAVQLEEAEKNLTGAIEQLKDQEEKAVKVSQTRLDQLQLTEKIAIASGENEVVAIRRTAENTVDELRRQEQAAFDYYQKRAELSNTTYSKEVAQIKSSTTQGEEQFKRLEKAKADQAQRLLEIESEYNGKVIALQEVLQQQIARVEAAAAAERQEVRKREVEELDLLEQEALAKIESNEEKGITSAENAAKAKIEARRNSIEAEQQLIEQQLEAENVGVEERKRLEEDLYGLKKELRELDIKEGRAVEEGRRKDADAAIAKEKALIDQKKALNQAELQALEAAGASETAIRQRSIQLRIQEIEITQQALRSEIALRREQQGDTAEVIQLETELIQLQGEYQAAVIQRAAVAEQAWQEEINNIEGVKDKLSEIPEAAEEATRQVGQGLAEFFSYINSLVGQAAGLTRDNIEKGISQLEELARAYVATAAASSPLISGLYEYAAQKAQQALEQARKKQREFAAEDAKARREEAQREADRRLEEARSEAERINEARLDAEENYRDAVADIQNDILKTDQTYLADRAKILEQSGNKIKEIEQQISDTRLRQKEKADQLLIQAEQKLQDALQEEANKAARSIEDTKQSNLVEQATLEGELAEAKQKGDLKKAEEIQKKLDRFSEDKALVDEQAAAEARARAQATSAEELQILLAGVREQFKSRQDFINQRRALEDKGRTDLIDDLTESFNREQNLIKENTRNQLNDLKNKLAEEQKAREDANKAEIDALNKRLADEKTAQDKALADLRKNYSDRVTELRNALKAEKDAYNETLTELERRTQEFANKFGASISEILSGISKLNDAASGVSVASGSSGGDTRGNGGGNSVGTNTDTSTTPPGSGTTPGTTDTRPNDPNREKGKNRNALEQILDPILEDFKEGRISFDEAIEAGYQAYQSSSYAKKATTWSEFIQELNKIQAELLAKAMEEFKNTGTTTIDLNRILGAEGGIAQARGFGKTESEKAFFESVQNFQGSPAGQIVREFVSNGMSYENAKKNLDAYLAQGTISQEAYDQARAIIDKEHEKRVKEATSDRLGGLDVGNLGETPATDAGDLTATDTTSPGSGSSSPPPGPETNAGKFTKNVAYTRIKIRAQDIREYQDYQKLLEQAKDGLAKKELSQSEFEDLNKWLEYYLKNNTGLEPAGQGGVQITDPSQLGGGSQTNQNLSQLASGLAAASSQTFAGIPSPETGAADPIKEATPGQANSGPNISIPLFYGDNKQAIFDWILTELGTKLDQIPK